MKYLSLPFGLMSKSLFSVILAMVVFGTGVSVDFSNGTADTNSLFQGLVALSQDEEAPPPPTDEDMADTVEAMTPEQMVNFVALEAFVAFIAEDLNTFWDRSFRVFRAPYLAPMSVELYTEPIETPCGPAELNNAFYCPVTHSIFYDGNFLNVKGTSIGDFAVAVVIAHEFGHAVQALLGLLGGFTIQLELQADCMAGAFTKYAKSFGLLTETDLDEAFDLLALIGDPEGIPFFIPGAHGTDEQRNAAFMAGFGEGVSRCFSIV